MKILIVTGIFLGLTLSLFFLKKLFKVSIKYALPVSFIIIALLGFGICYAIINCSTMLILATTIVSVAVIIFFIRIITVEIITPIYNTSQSLNHFSDFEFGEITPCVKKGNEVAILQNTILNLTNDFKAIMIEVLKNVETIQKYNDQFLHDFKSQHKKTSTNTSKKDNFNFNSENECSVTDLICKTELKKSGTACNLKLFKSFSIN